MRGCSQRSDSRAPSPSSVLKALSGLRKSCGFLKRSIPTSGSGLIDTIFAPRAFASASADSMRGWFVPGFCPMTKIASACSKSASVTVPLPMPMLSFNATPLDS